MGPLRLISSRVQERMIKMLKDQIKSTSNTAANTETVLKNHYSLSFKHWNTFNNEEKSSSYISLDILDELYPTARVFDFFLQLGAQPVNEHTMFESVNQFRCANGQILMQKRNSPVLVIVKHNNNDEFQLYSVRRTLIFNDTHYAVAIRKFVIFNDAIFDIYYYHNRSEFNECHVIEMNTVVSGVSLVPSFSDSNKTFVFWKN